MVVVVVIFRTELALLGDHMDQKSLVCFYMESSLPTGHREAQVPCDYSQGLGENCCGERGLLEDLPSTSQSRSLNSPSEGSAAHRVPGRPFSLAAWGPLCFSVNPVGGDRALLFTVEKK